MDYRQYEVYKYFLYLEQYVFGDLTLFHKLSRRAEMIESHKIRKDKEESEAIAREEAMGVVRPGYTRYPYGFSWHFGEPSPSRGTIPFTQMMLGCMDIIGYFIKGGEASKSHQNIIEFFTRVDSGPRKNEINCLIIIYRHGLVHSYFPKLGQAISYHSKNLGKPLFYRYPSGGVVLNVNMLEKYFIEGFKNIMDESSNYPFMEANFQRLMADYESKERIIIDRLGI